MTDGRISVWPSILVLISAALLAILILPSGMERAFATPGDCQSTTPAVSSMESVELVFTGSSPEEAEVRLTAKLAESPKQRAAGMQHLCPEAIRGNPILFVFEETIEPGFHMNNVHVPLDILFLNETGRVLEIHSMVPNGGLTYPSQPVRYALELYSGESARLGMAPGMRLQIQTR